MKKPELLSPAGNFEKLKAALLYGADAVYVGGKSFGMRSAADNFTDEELAAAVKYTHECGKKIYITVNIMPRGSEYGELRRYLAHLGEIKPDALIVADLGVLFEARRILPNMELHVSTQANILSPEAARAYASLGASRLVLSRELSLNEIKEIRDALPREIEIEAFIHGSMCVSYSGRCLLSNNLAGRDANRGECTQPCRWNYVLYEQKRPGAAIPIEENELGSFIMSSKDMCTIGHIPALIEAGIDSFKIEGRMKSAYYTAAVTNAYRIAIDEYTAARGAYNNQKERQILEARLTVELAGVSHREYCTGFYFDNPAENPQLCTEPGYMREKAYYATALDYPSEGLPANLPEGVAERTDGGRLYRFIQRNKLTLGSAAEIISPGRFGEGFIITELYDESGAPIESTPHPSMIYWTRVPFEVAPGDIMRSGSL